MEYLEITKDNIGNEHICCAISDKKCVDGYNLKKEWIKNEIDNGYTFYKLNERAKVFIEFGPTEKGWAPITAPNTTLINCFWVSGKYKGHGHGKTLLKYAEERAKENGHDAIVTIVGKKKFHFMSDTKWLLRQGFTVADETDNGFQILIKQLSKKNVDAKFNKECSLAIPNTTDITVYYSNRCPFTEFHITESLKVTAQNRNLTVKAIKLNNYLEAQKSPSPATIFSLYYKGEFVTTDLSSCMDSRFDKILSKNIKL